MKAVRFRPAKTRSNVVRMGLIFFHVTQSVGVCHRRTPHHMCASAFDVVCTEHQRRGIWESMPYPEKWQR